MSVSFENKDVYLLETVRKLSISLHSLVHRYPIQAVEIKKYWGPCYYSGTDEAISSASVLADAEFINARFQAALDFLQSVYDVEPTHYVFVLLTIAHFLNHPNDEAIDRLKPYMLDISELEQKEFIITGAVRELFRQASVPFVVSVGQTPRTLDVQKNQLVDLAIKHLRSHFLKTMAVFREKDFETAAGLFSLNVKLSFCKPILRNTLGTLVDDSEENLYDSSIAILSTPLRTSAALAGAVPRPKQDSAPLSLLYDPTSAQTSAGLRDDFSDDLVDLTMIEKRQEDSAFRIEEEQRKIKAVLEREDKERKKTPATGLAGFVFAPPKPLILTKDDDIRLQEEEQKRKQEAQKQEIIRKEEEARKQKEAAQKKKEREEAKQKEKQKKEEKERSDSIIRQLMKDDEEREKIKKDNELLAQENRNLQEAIRRSKLDTGAAVLHLKKQIAIVETQKDEELQQEREARAFAEAEREKERKRTEEYRLREFQKDEEHRKKQKEISILKEAEVLKEKKEKEKLIKELEKAKALKRGEYGYLDTPTSRDPPVTPFAPNKVRRNLFFNTRTDLNETEDFYSCAGSPRKQGAAAKFDDYASFEERDPPLEGGFVDDADYEAEFAEENRFVDERVCYYPDDPEGPPRLQNRRDETRFRNTFRKTEKNEYPSRIRTPHIDYFDFDLHGQTISEILGPRFYRYRFHDEVEREFTKKTILERILLSNESSELARHLALRGLGDFNATNFHQRGVDLTAMISRQCIAEAANPRASDNRVPPPNMGTNGKCHPSILKGLNTTLNSEKFCPEGGKQIDYFLDKVSSTISMYKFDEECSYGILKFVLKHQSPLYNVVAEEQRKGTPFLQTWTYVQTSMAPSFNGEKIETQMKKLLASRPTGSLGPHLVAIHDLAIQKFAPNSNQSEKDTQVFFYTRDMIFSLLKKFYPFMLQPVVDAFRKVERMKETTTGVYLDQYGPVDLDQTDRVKTLIQVISNLERDHALVTGEHSVFISSAQFNEENVEASVNATAASAPRSVPKGSAPVTKEYLDEALASIAATEARHRNKGPKNTHFANSGPSKVEKQLDDLTSMVCSLNNQNTTLQQQIALSQSKASSQSLPSIPAQAPQQGFFASQPVAQPVAQSPVTQTLAPSNTYTHQSAQAQQMTAQNYQTQSAPQYQHRNQGSGFGRGGYRGHFGGYRGSRPGHDANFTPMGGGYQGYRPQGGFRGGFGGNRAPYPRQFNDQRPPVDNRDQNRTFNQQPRGGYNAPRFNRRPNDPSLVCDLCGFKASHTYTQCFKYPNMTPDGPVCSICEGRHPVPCRANFRNQTQAPNQQQQAPRTQNQTQNQDQPQRGPGGFLGNSGQQPLPQHVTMNATQVDYSQGIHPGQYQHFMSGQLPQ